MVDAKREYALAAQRLSEALYGTSLPDEQTRRYAMAAVGDLVERLERAEHHRHEAARQIDLDTGTRVPVPRSNAAEMASAIAAASTPAALPKRSRRR